MNINTFDIATLPNPSFRFCNIGGCQSKMNTHTCGVHCLQIRNATFCSAMLWFVLKYGVGPVRPQIDGCRLEIQNSNKEMKLLRIGAIPSAKSIHSDYYGQDSSTLV